MYLDICGNHNFLYFMIAQCIWIFMVTTILLIFQECTVYLDIHGNHNSFDISGAYLLCIWVFVIMVLYIRSTLCMWIFVVTTIFCI